MECYYAKEEDQQQGGGGGGYKKTKTKGYPPGGSGRPNSFPQAAKEKSLREGQQKDLVLVPLANKKGMAKKNKSARSDGDLPKTAGHGGITVNRPAAAQSQKPSARNVGIVSTAQKQNQKKDKAPIPPKKHQGSTALISQKKHQGTPVLVPPKKQQGPPAPIHPKKHQALPTNLGNRGFKKSDFRDTFGFDNEFEESKYNRNPNVLPWFKHCGLNGDFRDADLSRYYVGNTIVHPDGYIVLRLYGDVRIDITASQSFRILNDRANTIMALSSSGESFSMIHPSGRLYKHGANIEVDTASSHEEPKYAKATPNKITFTSDRRAAVFMTTPTGFAKTVDKFSDLSLDISVPVYMDRNTFCGPSAVEECLAHLHNTQFSRSLSGDERWLINGIEITYKVDDGLIIVRRAKGNFQFRTSFVNGNSSIYAGAGAIKVFGSVGRFGKFRVLFGDQDIENKEGCFFIRSGDTSIGFNQESLITVFNEPVKKWTE